MLTSLDTRIIQSEVPAELEDEDLGHAAQRGQVAVVEALQHVGEADEAALAAAEVVVAGGGARVPVRRHHDEQALHAHHRLLQPVQRLQRLLAHRYASL